MDSGLTLRAPRNDGERDAAPSLGCHSGARRSREPGIHFTTERVARWIPGSRCVRPGMRREWAWRSSDRIGKFSRLFREIFPMGNDHLEAGQNRRHTDLGHLLRLPSLCPMGTQQFVPCGPSRTDRSAWSYSCDGSPKARWHDLQTRLRWICVGSGDNREVHHVQGRAFMPESQADRTRALKGLLSNLAGCRGLPRLVQPSCPTAGRQQPFDGSASRCLDSDQRRPRRYSPRDQCSRGGRSAVTH
jgi:hypothetical protein